MREMRVPAAVLLSATLCTACTEERRDVSATVQIDQARQAAQKTDQRTRQATEAVNEVEQPSNAAPSDSP